MARAWIQIPPLFFFLWGFFSTPMILVSIFKGLKGPFWAGTQQQRAVGGRMPMHRHSPRRSERRGLERWCGSSAVCFCAWDPSNRARGCRAEGVMALAQGVLCAAGARGPSCAAARSGTWRNETLRPCPARPRCQDLLANAGRGYLGAELNAQNSSERLKRGNTSPQTRFAAPGSNRGRAEKSLFLGAPKRCCTEPPVPLQQGGGTTGTAPGLLPSPLWP